MKILVLGVNGLIGSTVYRVLSRSYEYEVFGSVRNQEAAQSTESNYRNNLRLLTDISNTDELAAFFEEIEPAAIINCIGLTKHRVEAADPLQAIPTNTLFPHKLASMSRSFGARLIHISTDCVFSGKAGGYLESDLPDASDLYGQSKALGELISYDTALTLRTSTIGHEPQSAYGLLEWFLLQQGKCLGFRNAIFSGLPTVVFAEIIRDFVIPNSDLCGLYHIAADPINKYDLLSLIAHAYGRDIEIVPDDRLKIDRSLDATKFNEVTGYKAPEWPQLISAMRNFL